MVIFCPEYENRTQLTPARWCCECGGSARLRADDSAPAHASPAKQAQIAVYAAKVHPVPGPRGNAKLAAIGAAEKGLTLASHAYHPCNLRRTASGGLGAVGRSRTGLVHRSRGSGVTSGGIVNSCVKKLMLGDKSWLIL